MFSNFKILNPLLGQKHPNGLSDECAIPPLEIDGAVEEIVFMIVRMENQYSFSFDHFISNHISNIPVFQYTNTPVS